MAESEWESKVTSDTAAAQIGAFMSHTDSHGKLSASRGGNAVVMARPVLRVEQEFPPDGRWPTEEGRQVVRTSPVIPASA